MAQYFGWDSPPQLRPVGGEAMQRKSPSTQMSNQLTRRDFAIRTSGFALAGFNLAKGLASAATLAEAERASRSENSPAVADPYSLVDPELVPTLKQFPAFDLSLDMAIKVRQMPGTSPLPAPQPVQRYIPGPGAPEVRLWIVHPAPLEKGKPRRVLADIQRSADAQEPRGLRELCQHRKDWPKAQASVTGAWTSPTKQ